ncbi:hypothetical protein [Paenibacillus sp. S150]|uniref:hypothetical protein n=1 Tax=Paenibacillus sp. S150 TaxID=2749826 RepID=UPI001C599EAC|nr:hypothetical protein [Paenibacillus sp. S150]MBW4083652.1 hypothetical protein [Paenibacillus sp. S150]
MDGLLRVAQNIIDQIPIPPSMTYLVLVSETKEQIGLSVQAYLDACGFETYFVRLSPKIEHGFLTLQDVVGQFVNSQSGVICLLQPEHAFFLFDTFGRPDMGFKQPMKYIYCDWLMPVDNLEKNFGC